MPLDHDFRNPFQSNVFTLTHCLSSVLQYRSNKRWRLFQSPLPRMRNGVPPERLRIGRASSESNLRFWCIRWRTVLSVFSGF